MPRSLVSVALLTIALGLSVEAGCRGPSGPPRYDLSGAVTYGGKPVPAGYLVLAPDTANGNDGPGSQAEIHDGRYQTAPGQGIVGGRYVVTISGFDGKPIELSGGMKNPQGTPLFPTYRVEVILPEQVATHDFDVPAVGGKSRGL
jgi:hypothetical protein